MEIKTCEEYVLAELKKAEIASGELKKQIAILQEQNRALKERLSGEHTEFCKNVSPQLDDDMNNGVAQFKCSVCGCALHSWNDDTFGVILDMSSHFAAVSYCPNCGREVISK